MKGVKSLVIIGIAILIFGLIFHLQGQSVIGPESSFMYSNPDWITYGSYDVVAEFVTDTPAQMNEIIISKIRKLQKIRSTITLRVVN